MKALEKILKSELLTDEMKNELKESVDSMKAEMNESAKKELEIQYAEKLVEHKKNLSEMLSKMMSETIDSEIADLKENIIYYKQLETKYAKDLVEFKTEFKTKFNESMVALVEGTVKQEISELEENLMEVKKNTLGRRVFEALKDDLMEFGLGDDAKELSEKLEKSEKNLKESQDEVIKLKRKQIISKVLKPLKGSKREVMETILESVHIDKIEDRYNETIGSVMKENKDDSVVDNTISDVKTLSDLEKDTIRTLFGRKE